MSIVLAHPTGNQVFRHLAAGMHRHNELAAVATCLRWNPKQREWLDRLFPPAIRRELRRRSFDEVWAAGMRTRPQREAARLLLQRLGRLGGRGPSLKWGSVDAVYVDFDQWVSRHIADWATATEGGAVYAYEDAAVATFGAARELGLHCAYDLPIAYWEAGLPLLLEEAARLPDWAPTITGLTDSQDQLDRRIHELELADLVVCPSEFVAKSLPDWASSKEVVVAPFGSPPGPASAIASATFQARRERAAAGEPLRVLFAGSMGQRKGLADLFAAVTRLRRRDVELVVMGTPLQNMAFYKRHFADFRYEPGRPHADVLSLMRSCDALCLPSLVEGRALVMQEAMSQGLPLIITPNTGGEDLLSQAPSKSTVLRGRGGEQLPGWPSAQGRSSVATGLAGEPRGNSEERARGDTGGVSGRGRTTARAAPDLVYGRSPTGFLVPIRAPEKIAEAIDWLADHRSEAVEMGNASLLKAASYAWETYGDTIMAAMKTLPNSRRA
jgi:glycosyltransferase involved in cell wall biosynthesis